MIKKRVLITKFILQKLFCLENPDMRIIALKYVVGLFHNTNHHATLRCSIINQKGLEIVEQARYNR